MPPGRASLDSGAPARRCSFVAVIPGSISPTTKALYAFPSMTSHGPSAQPAANRATISTGVISRNRISESLYREGAELSRAGAQELCAIAFVLTLHPAGRDGDDSPLS